MNVETTCRPRIGIQEISLIVIAAYLFSYFVWSRYAAWYDTQYFNAVGYYFLLEPWKTSWKIEMTIQMFYAPIRIIDVWLGGPPAGGEPMGCVF